MQVDYPNLKVSPTGWYSYRRAIPNRLRWLFEERREYKVSFKTKNKNHAVRKWHEQESLWARTQSLALNLAANQDKQVLRELQVQAENLRLSWGLTDNDLSNMETLQRDELAEQERDFISKRTIAALTEAKKRGVLLGGRRKGAEKRHIAVKAEADRNASKVIDLIKPLKDAGQTLQQIADGLNTSGVPTSRGGKWYPISVKRVLKRMSAVG